MSRHHAQIHGTPEWTAVKRECHERDGWACVMCGATENLQADHKLRLSDYPELALDLDNLQTLCPSCHAEKERNNAQQNVIRNTWINAKYPELNGVVVL